MYRRSSAVAFLVLLFSVTVLFPAHLYAQNNRFGVHVLNPSEIEHAAKIINGNGGDWGYLTIPIRANDRSLTKWQKFMDDAKRLHIIPIIRLAGEPQGSLWRKPSFDEVIDFSNFLNDLSWPTKVKHVIVFNEPNHGSEWGDTVNPSEYAAILKFSIYRFNSLDQNFLVLPGALDASVPDSATSMSQYRFFRKMFSDFPELPDMLEALNSHSYPNPNFSSPPTNRLPKGITTFSHELKFLKAYTDRKLPVFITETGWQMETLSGQTVAEYYREAFSKVWNNEQVVAVTPFLLHAAEGPFQKFSLLTKDFQLTEPAKLLSELPKIQGIPEIASDSSQPRTSYVLGDSSQSSHPIVTFRRIGNFVSEIWSWIKRDKKLTIGSSQVQVELADTPAKQQRGLSYRKSLADGHGMLFKFKSSSLHSFWMKDMHFPLDFIWINNFTVVDLSENVPFPKNGEQPVSLGPSSPVDMVLEVPANFIFSNKINIGDKVKLAN